MKTRLLLLITVIVFSVILTSMHDTYAGVPFERVPISSFGVYSMDENQLNKVEVGQQIMFRSDIENVQDIKQSLVYAVQVFDQNQERVLADWIDTTLEPKSFSSPSVLWTPTVIGNYTATSTVWESMDNPTAFSAIWEIEFEVVHETENKMEQAQAIPSPNEEFTGEQICGEGNVLVDGVCVNPNQEYFDAGLNQILLFVSIGAIVSVVSFVIIWRKRK